MDGKTLDGYELAPALEAIYAPIRESYKDDVRRSDFCDGCRLFGLCIWHAVLEEGHVERSKATGKLIKR
jgi:hypothetical protein